MEPQQHARRQANGRFAPGNPGGPGRPKGRKSNPPPLSAETLRLQILRDLAAGPDAISVAQLELAISRTAAGRSPDEVDHLVAEHVDTAVHIARAARRVLIAELERQAAGQAVAAPTPPARQAPSLGPAAIISPRRVDVGPFPPPPTST